MEDAEFQGLLRELRVEYPAPTEVAEATAKLLEALRQQNQALQSRVTQLETRVEQLSLNAQVRYGR